MNDNVIMLDKDEWSTLVLLKDSIKHLKNKDNVKYRKTIDKEQRMFNEILHAAIT